MRLSNFKITHEDDQSLHLSHHNGGKIIISKKDLSHSARKLIQRFQDGGEVEPPQSSDEAADQTWRMVGNAALNAISDQSPPPGQDQIQPSLDPMDIIPPERMAALGAAGAKIAAGKLAAVKAGAVMAPMVGGAIKKVATTAAEDLPMDAASRMSRAEQMGFDAGKTYYHGTTDSIENIDKSKLSDIVNYGKGFYVANEPHETNEFISNGMKSSVENPNKYEWNYKEGSNVIPVNIKTKNTLDLTKPLPKYVLDDLGKMAGLNQYLINNNYSKKSGEHFFKSQQFDALKREDVTKYLKSMGYDSMKDDWQTVVFEPDQIRSVNAAFDPKKENSSNISHYKGGEIQMNPQLSSFKLAKEDESAFHITHPNGKNMVIEKAKLSKNAHKIIQKMTGNAKHFADGGEAEPNLEANASQSPSPNDFSLQPQPQQAPASPVGSYENPVPVQPGQTPETAKPPVAQLPAKPPLSHEDPFEVEKQANLAGAQAIAGQGAQSVQAIQNVQSQMAKMPSDADIAAKYSSQNKMQYDAMLNSKIDPERYWHSLGTGSKIAAGIGMLLGGIGSALTGQPNPAYQMIERNINADIEAQRNDQHKAQTLWGMNRQAMGDDLSASLATKNQMYVGLKYKLDQASAQFKGPQAQAEAQKANAILDQKINMNNAILGLVRGAPGTEQDYAAKLAGVSRLDPATYKEIEGRYIPGVGVAKVPVTPEDRSELINYDSLAKGIDKAMQFQSDQSKTGLLGSYSSANRAEAEGIKNGLVLAMGKLNDMKRPPSPEIMKLYQESIGNIGGQNITAHNMTALKDLREQVESRKQSVTNGLGVTPFKKAPDHNTALEWAKMNPTNPDAIKIIQFQQRGR